MKLKESSRLAAHRTSWFARIERDMSRLFQLRANNYVVILWQHPFNASARFADFSS
jgi:hypothetical protein